MTSTIELTAEQERVAFAPPELKQLILAGPGTGKTHALIARAANLISQGLRPGSEILILSFSRAAVAEIRARVSKLSGDVAYIRIRTFDSFATRILAEIEPEGQWMYEGYEGRIRECARSIRGSLASRLLAPIQHVLVDEVQDVLGERLELVKALLTSQDIGFTLFGDPAQGIYNFASRGEHEANWALIQWVRREFGDRLRETRLVGNKRSNPSGESTLLAQWAGEALLGEDSRFTNVDGNIDYERIHDGLVDALLQLRTLGTVASAIPFLKSTGLSTAILTRTNAEALLASREIWRVGVEHELQKAATDRAIPMWVALALRGFDTPTVGHDAMIGRISSVVPGEVPEDLWNMLKRAEAAGGPSLNLSLLNRRVALGATPETLTASNLSQLVVSTIHRAKGREYEQVAVAIDPKDALGVVDSLDEESRLLFVALTRARLKAFHLSPPPSGAYRLHENTDRWIQRGWGSQNWRLNEVEVKTDDMSRMEPPGLSSSGEDPLATQEYIQEKVRKGDEVELRLSDTIDGETTAEYSLYHADRLVGIASDDFVRDLLSILRLNRQWTVSWPKRISSLVVGGVDTVAGPIDAGRKAGLGSSGLWLRVQAYGLGRVHFS